MVCLVVTTNNLNHKVVGFSLSDSESALGSAKAHAGSASTKDHVVTAVLVKGAGTLDDAREEAIAEAIRIRQLNQF